MWRTVTRGSARRAHLVRTSLPSTSSRPTWKVMAARGNEVRALLLPSSAPARLSRLTLSLCQAKQNGTRLAGTDLHEGGIVPQIAQHGAPIPHTLPCKAAPAPANPRPGLLTIGSGTNEARYEQRDGIWQAGHSLRSALVRDPAPHIPTASARRGPARPRAASEGPSRASALASGLSSGLRSVERHHSTVAASWRLGESQGRARLWWSPTPRGGT